MRQKKHIFKLIVKKIITKVLIIWTYEISTFENSLNPDHQDSYLMIVLFTGLDWLDCGISRSYSLTFRETKSFSVKSKTFSYPLILAYVLGSFEYPQHMFSH